MFPSIAVKRRTYELLGGFHPSLFHSADWDMWKRIATRFRVWYDPEPLALYRIHRASDTSRLMQTGANILDARRAIAIAEAYLPADRVEPLSRKARLYHALYAMELARGKQYDVALVDASLGDMDAWALLSRLRQGRRPIPHLALTKAARSVSERLKAWRVSTALLEDPPDPERLDAWLSRIEVGPAG